MLKGLFPLDPGEAMSPRRPSHGAQTDTSHPLAPARPWDISARSTVPVPSPGWVGSASPECFAPVPGASFTASPRTDAFQGWEKRCQLGHIHSFLGLLGMTWAFSNVHCLETITLFRGCIFPSSSSRAGVGTWCLALMARGCLGQQLSPSHGCYPAAGPRWDSESPCPMH